MKQTQELLETGIYEEFQVESKKTVGDIIREIGFSEMFGILINGRKVDDVNYQIKESDKVVILPIIAGGH